eukprot:TRINITY_DN9380_c0_g2_i3.p1 TRINITY_DN9380_c0_g2~~TRINITY_DN9380_c0_g2_i3.p1  ORF type:complete len:525 (+),score=85.69 TRINITY_DN9380_c0_g2_i3:1043-2617(+)
MASISSEALRKCSELTPQDISTIGWSFATLSNKDEPLIAAISDQAIRRITELNPQHLSNTGWAVAVLGYCDENLMGAIASGVLRRLSEFDPQNVSNTAWSFATLSLGSASLFKALAYTASDFIKSKQFEAQELSNTGWAFARCVFRSEPLFDLIAASFHEKLAEFSVQDLTNIPWAFAQMSFQNDHMFQVIAEKVFNGTDDFTSDLSASMLLWTFWKAGLTEESLEFFKICSDDDVFLQPEPFGVIFMINDWWKDVSLEKDLLQRLYRVLPMRSVQSELIKLKEAVRIPLTSFHTGLQKVAKLVDSVEAELTVGNATEILESCERFAKYKGQWLKVAGLDKADLLEAAIEGRPVEDHEILAEFGAFVGYTAVRLGAALQRRSALRPPGLASLEVNPVHVCVARHLLDLGRLSNICEVKNGQAKDVLPRLAEEFGCKSAGFCFMDHRGTIFHQDFGLMQSYKLFAHQARFVADNILNPGAPSFSWERCQQSYSRQNQVATTCYSLTEFLAEHEDWTSVSDLDVSK